MIKSFVAGDCSS